MWPISMDVAKPTTSDVRAEPLKVPSLQDQVDQYQWSFEVVFRGVFQSVFVVVMASNRRMCRTPDYRQVKW